MRVCGVHIIRKYAALSDQSVASRHLLCMEEIAKVICFYQNEEKFGLPAFDLRNWDGGS